MYRGAKGGTNGGRGAGSQSREGERPKKIVQAGQLLHRSPSDFAACSALGGHLYFTSEAPIPSTALLHSLALPPCAPVLQRGPCCYHRTNCAHRTQPCWWQAAPSRSCSRWPPCSEVRRKPGAACSPRTGDECQHAVVQRAARQAPPALARLLPPPPPSSPPAAWFTAPPLCFTLVSRHGHPVTRSRHRPRHLEEGAGPAVAPRRRAAAVAVGAGGAGKDAQRAAPHKGGGADV